MIDSNGSAERLQVLTRHHNIAEGGTGQDYLIYPHAPNGEGGRGRPRIKHACHTNVLQDTPSILPEVKFSLFHDIYRPTYVTIRTYSQLLTATSFYSRRV